MNTRLYLITGFLGSGKTTLMKRLLTADDEMKTGIIVNEFGREGIDGSLLESGNIEMSEINNGSIFCTCRSERFIEALILLSEKNLDYVFIETSGMANPRGMGEIIDIIKKQTGFEYDYRGCITVVDASNVKKLITVSTAVSDQISYADYILINKTDLVSPVELDTVRKAVRQLNEVAQTVETTHADTDDNHRLLKLAPLTNKSGPLTTAAQSGVRKLSVEFPCLMDKSKFRKFIEIVSPMTYRFKGFIRLDGKPYRIDCAGENISLEPLAGDPSGFYAEVIADSKKPLGSIFKKTYNEIMGEDPVVKIG